MPDGDFMRRALDLSAGGRGWVEPNPMVGCVLVRDGQVLAEGYHERFGGPHAEPSALAKCRDARGATAYVTLEPCCHRNKKTPPCVPALLAAGITRVVATIEDPNPAVSGKGLAELGAAGVKVECGLLGESARQLNAAYFKLLREKAPYVTLKWAQTADGKIAGAGGRRLTISNPAVMAAIHRLRGRCGAILVGIGTVISDDPLLTSRAPEAPGQPLRIVLDSKLRITPQHRLIQTARNSPVLVACGAEAAASQKAGDLRAAGAEILALPVDGAGGLSLKDLLAELGSRRISHLLVEPGGRVAESFLGEGLADRVWISRSPKAVDAADAPAAARIDYPAAGSMSIEGDELSEYLNPQSPAFFALEESADFALEKVRLQGSASSNC
jgi:diaminohydroxyphosphoribosylaminopyrimidine deaminase/5-amino-6-(5-phosphoribosylamino)uracil reductase